MINIMFTQINKLIKAPIQRLLEITLDYNIASFNNVVYRQKKGAAMGPKNSCEYADCAMEYIDQLVNTVDLSLRPVHAPLFWARLRVQRRCIYRVFQKK